VRARQDDNEEDLPGWVAILDTHQRPIDTKRLNEDELVAEFETRFVALLQKSGSVSSLDGWRDVAIDLAFEFHPAFKIKEQKALPVSGRPITSFRWMIKNAFLSRKRKLERDAEREAFGTRREGKPIQKAAQAAREVAKEWAAAEAKAKLATRHLSAEQSDGIDETPTAKTIQNLASERIPFPAEWTSEDYLYAAKLAARVAARRITEV
jgi:hypothetical protein